MCNVWCMLFYRSPSTRYRLLLPRVHWHFVTHGRVAEPLILQQGRFKLKKVLVLTVLAGMGHVRAAEAVCEGIKHVSPEAVVKLLDPLEEKPKGQRFINNFYVFMVRRMPHLWGYFYNSRLISGVYSQIRWDITQRYPAFIAQNI